MTPYGVAHVNGSPADGPGACVELCAQMIRLEHVPVGLYHLTHPHAVVGAMDHMNAL